MLTHPVHGKHLEAIGDIVVSYAVLESVIQTLAWSLINEHQRIGQVITTELSFKNLRALVVSLYKEQHGVDDDFIELKKLINQAGTIEEKRNQIVHSIWGAGRGPEYITRIKATAKESSGLRFKFYEVSYKDLENEAFQIRGLAEAIQAFWIKLLKAGKAINTPGEKQW